MIGNSLPPELNKDFQDGKQVGFEVAESYIKNLVKKNESSNIREFRLI